MQEYMPRQELATGMKTTSLFISRIEFVSIMVSVKFILNIMLSFFLNSKIIKWWNEFSFIEKHSKLTKETLVSGL